MELILGSLLLTVVILLYYWVTRNQNYWKNRNIPQLKTLPFFGYMLPFLSGRENYHATVKRIYDELRAKQLSYGGSFEMTKPMFILSDPEMVVDITMKYFNHFRKRGISLMFNPNHRSLNPLSDNVVTADGHRWKTARSKHSHTFTTQKHRKILLEHTQHSLSELQKALFGGSGGDVELKELSLRYVVDVIGSWGFGLECSSYKAEESDFMKYAKLAFTCNFTLKRTLLRVCPQVLDLIRMHDFKPEVTKFYVELILSTLRYRKENNISRGDFLDALIDLMDENVKAGVKFDEIDLAAEAFATFVAGYESTSTALSFALYEIAVNTDVQDKIREEVVRLKKQHGDTLPLDSLNDMKYLDMVLEEAIRKYPADPAIVRECTERFMIPGTKSWIEPDTVVLIPVHGFHRDPTFYPDPEKFDPERFSPENKSSIPKGAYLAWGEGQRMCAGIRSAQLIIKMAISELVYNYKLSPCAKTDIPLPFLEGAGTFVLIPKNGVWANFTKISY